MMELLGYDSEDQLWEDMGLERSDISQAMADGVLSEFESMDLAVSSEDAKALGDSILAMLERVEFTAEVAQSDEKEGKAVVTCTVSSFSMDAALEEMITRVLSDAGSFDTQDEDALMGAMINILADIFANLEPSGTSEGFDVDFELESGGINGKLKRVWLPADPEDFGLKIGERIMAG